LIPLSRILSSLRRRGGCAIKKMLRSLRSGADGVVGNFEQSERYADDSHVRSVTGGCALSRLRFVPFFDRRGPPRLGKAGSKTPRDSTFFKLIRSPRSWRYGYDLSRETELKAGTLYPILMRLTEYELLEAQWMTTEEGTPPRHMYRLTPKGVQVAREKLAETHAGAHVRRVVPSGGKA